jgi:hypothetical protein
MQMLSKKIIQKWLITFDLYKYPPSAYQELVFERFDSDNKYIVLGAWKTGCLRVHKSGTFYCDSTNKKYRVTKRWKEECPVGFDTWHYINEHRKWFEGNLPNQLPDTMPDVLTKLIKRRGFGFVWAIFAAHCYLPEVYPLYDQHVYRAYKALQTDNRELPDTSPTNWQEYLNYVAFFRNQMAVAELSQADCDRALWAFGKDLKLKKQRSNRVREGRASIEIATRNLDDIPDDFVHSQTLGGKSKSFWWKIDDTCSIHIYRDISKKTGLIIDFKEIEQDDIERLLEYLSQFDNFFLANSVDRLGNGAEREDGIGYFLYNSLQWNTTHSQLASQLASIFLSAGVWESNGRKRNIEFRFLDIQNWCKLVRYHYSELLQVDD